MGYRHYFYKVNKADVETVKDMSYEELLKYAQANNVEVDLEDKHFRFNDKAFVNKVEVHEFGKLYRDNTAKRIYDKGVPLFTNKETKDFANQNHALLNCLVKWGRRCGW